MYTWVFKVSLFDLFYAGVLFTFCRAVYVGDVMVI
jgi:hypothetical protein